MAVTMPVIDTDTHITEPHVDGSHVEAEVG